MNVEGSRILVTAGLATSATGWYAAAAGAGIEIARRFNPEELEPNPLMTGGATAVILGIFAITAGAILEHKIARAESKLASDPNL